MGAHYQSLQIKSPSREAVVTALDSLIRTHRKARLFIGPEFNGWIAVYLNDHAFANTFATELAGILNCVVLDLMVYHSDIFFYNFYEKGGLADEYSSQPDYFEEVSSAEREKLRGKPRLFRDLLGPDKSVAEIESLLISRGEEKFLFEEDRMEQFVKLLGIENTRTSYEYLTDGEWDGIKGRKDFLHLPDLTAEKAAARSAAAALRAEFKRLKNQGVFCFESRPPKKRGHHTGEAVFDPLTSGIVFKWHESPERNIMIAKPPWTSEPEPITVPPSATTPYNLIFSKTGKRFAYFDGQLRLWDWPERKLVEGIDIRSKPLQFSSDEAWLLCENSRRFEIFSMETMRTIQSVDGGAEHPYFRAWHPSRKFLITRPYEHQLGLINFETGKFIKTLGLGTASDLAKLAARFSKTPADISEQLFAPVLRGRGVAGSFKLEFSPDGRYLFCATTIGVLVLEWDKVLAAERSTPVALFAASALPPDPHMQQPTKDYYRNFVYDLVFDEKANRVLFAGNEGAVRFLNLNDSSTGILLKPPALDAICRLQMSHDREFIYSYCVPSQQERPNSSHCMRIWNYRLLRETAGLE